MTETTRLRLDVSYDGGDFSGWAAQPTRRTVAGVLIEALRRLAGPDAELGLTVAGRTDAGVHATGQVCHIELPTELWETLRGSLLRRLAALMPPDARVKAVTEVPGTFDARFSATFRRYEYRVADTPYGPDPLRRHDTLGWVRPLDLGRLNAAAEGLVGLHDFAAFCKRKEHATTIRAITRLDWRRDPDGIAVATVQADAFCQAMVRSLVGAMLTVGDGRRDPGWPAKLLTLRERSSEVTVAPAHGLTLVEVGYPDEAEYAGRADATRRLRSAEE
ncbi:tRNA pseudouridine(38-40) synthase TruA [Symbioplanes lichenis]|uniref:tRNA pseudouridine(38-40) synthase TruA n=1 Tax=Symbioplanes lichenis TaxID=1629072 RepID=UPI002738B379|nr:tRNA pseudouridine(38-40) synthase TruA [Actinoplanes lichenis]